jgi:hypothetical protein
MSPAMISDTRSDRLWMPILMLAAIVGSFAFACAAPFAALAVMLALTLTLRRGVALIAAAWLLNQAIGYGVLDYPWTMNSLVWGIAIGLAAVAATGAAYAVADRSAGIPGLARAALAFIAAFAVFEMVLLAFGLMLGETVGFAPAIVREVALVNVLWLAALLLFRELLGAAGRRRAAAG